MTCTHFWSIEPANGPTSEGKCKRCGATKQFLNYIDEPFVADFKARREAREELKAARSR